ncbi:MAG: hypothetical protein ACWA5P_13550 [bacterium]
MRYFALITIAILYTSCIPLRTAPNIETDKIYLGKKFKKSLAKTHYLIFEDSKNAFDFYHFINAKYQLNHENVGYNVPIHIEGTTYYLTYLEVERENKTLNLLPMMIDAAINDDCEDPMLQELYTSRQGYWYIALEVRDENLKDALKPNYPERKAVATYLRNLRKEYYATSNYNELLLKKKRP